MKTQTVRLLDVFLFGPVIMYAGTRKELPIWLRLSLLAIGAGTVVYNGLNYMKVDKEDGVQDQSI